MFGVEVESGDSEHWADLIALSLQGHCHQLMTLCWHMPAQTNTKDRSKKVNIRHVREVICVYEQLNMFKAYNTINIPI